MKHSKRRRRSSQVPKQQNCGSNSVSGAQKVINGGNNEEERTITNLVEAFSLVSIEDVKIAYNEANGDPNKAAEILSGLADDDSENCNGSTSSSSQSFGFGSNSSENSLESSVLPERVNGRMMRGSRGKQRVVASTGIVSTVLGKNYVSASSRKEIVKEKGFGGGKVKVEEMEQFLLNMLGDDCELGLGVVKDVLCTCEFDVEKALEVLLDLSAPHCETSGSDKYSSSSSSSAEYSRNIDSIDNFWQLSDWGSDSNSHSSESDVPDNVRLLEFSGRNYAEALISSDPPSKLPAAGLRSMGSDLPHQVLESLFHIPKSVEHDPTTMNWRNVVKQMEAFAQKRVKLGASSFMAQELSSQEEGEEYKVFRETARQQWDKTRTCYQKAAAAYSNGEKNYAAYMSEQGKLSSKMAREADEKASMQIFKARNKGIENVLTIDLHGQHVKPAMRLVKLHLLFGTYISSVQYIRIITGCGSSGVGKSVLKQSVIKLLKNEGIAWSEENQGTVLVRLDGPREFSFLDSESDTEAE